MAFFQNLSSTVAASENAFNSVTNGNISTTANNLKAALSNASSGNIASAIRSMNLPQMGETVGDLYSAVAEFSPRDNPNDWRVRLSIPTWPSFNTSPVLAPLRETGGMIFPYTPMININNTASYDDAGVIQTNYEPQVYKKSTPSEINITADMNVEDSTQGLYWIASIHYLRSLTKMFSGYDSKAGTPPPVVFLNAYGQYIFKDVPVVVSRISVQLDDKCDYIAVNVVGSMAGDIEGIANQVSGLSNTIGSTFSSAAGIASAVSTTAGTVGQVAALAGQYNIGGSISAGVTHVPSKSRISVTLKPAYSRDNIRKFSLDRFVTGGYVNNSFGFI